MRDGEIINAVSEERFSRIKNDSRFPIKSINWVLKHNELDVSDIDVWVYATNEYSAEYQLIRRYDQFGIDDYIREQDEYWYPKIYKKSKISYLSVFGDKADFDQFPRGYWKRKFDGDLNDTMPGDYRVQVLNELGVMPDKVKTVEHHNCHLSYAYFTSKFAYKESVMGVTIDGIGDGLNATITLIDKEGNFNRVYQTGIANLGRLYRYITLLLGMKPNEHEYKMMGLAPYAKDEYLDEVKKIFDEYICVDNGEFKIRNNIPDSYFYYRDRLKSFRFDNIAGGVQKYVESLLVKWIQQNIEKYHIDKVVLSGGVGMNIKAMGEVVNKTDLRDFYVPGNPSDESNCIGAAYYYNHSLGNLNKALSSLYLGFAPYKDLSVIKDAKSRYKVVHNPSNDLVIEQLMMDKVVGRCVGEMEFGARALGNRSLLAKSDNIEIKDKINHMIKNRDFWMPFAPIILDKYSDRYLENEKKIESPYMTVGFGTTLEGRNALKAALHQADNTVRAQIINRVHNAVLYDFIDDYSNKTGYGCMLNTSFNLHGFPIVSNQEDAYYVFNNSSLDCLWFDEWLIMR